MHRPIVLLVRCSLFHQLGTHWRILREKLCVDIRVGDSQSCAQQQTQCSLSSKLSARHARTYFPFFHTHTNTLSLITHRHQTERLQSGGQRLLSRISSLQANCIFRSGRSKFCICYDRTAYICWICSYTLACGSGPIECLIINTLFSETHHAHTNVWRASKRASKQSTSTVCMVCMHVLLIMKSHCKIEVRNSLSIWPVRVLNTHTQLMNLKTEPLKHFKNEQTTKMHKRYRQTKAHTHRPPNCTSKFQILLLV